MKYSTNHIYDTWRPDGFHTVTPYLFVRSPQALIDFLTKAFFARELNRSLMPNGDLSNVILSIGDTCFMISQARNEFENMKTAMYLYVDDVDNMHQRALEAGARALFEPADMPYGDRQSGIIDPAGNYWWISKRLIRKGYDE